MPTIFLLVIILVLAVIGGIYWLATKGKGDSGGEVQMQSHDRDREEHKGRS